MLDRNYLLKPGLFSQGGEVTRPGEHRGMDGRAVQAGSLFEEPAGRVLLALGDVVAAGEGEYAGVSGGGGDEIVVAFGGGGGGRQSGSFTFALRQQGVVGAARGHPALDHANEVHPVEAQSGGESDGADKEAFAQRARSCGGSTEGLVERSPKSVKAGIDLQFVENRQLLNCRHKGVTVVLLRRRERTFVQVLVQDLLAPFCEVLPSLAVIEAREGLM